jgi:hypothetical protein
LNILYYFWQPNRRVHWRETADEASLHMVLGALILELILSEKLFHGHMGVGTARNGPQLFAPHSQLCVPD